MVLGSHRSHRSHRLSLWVENLTEAGGWGVSECSDFQRLTQIQRDSTRRLFVEICGDLWQKKSLQKNICVIREIRGFRSRIQKSYKKFGIESKNLIIFSESIPNLYPLCPPWPFGSHRLHSYIILPRLHMIANIPCIIVHSQILPVLFYRWYD